MENRGLPRSLPTRCPGVESPHLVPAPPLWGPLVLTAAKAADGRERHVEEQGALWVVSVVPPPVLSAGAPKPSCHSLGSQAAILASWFPHGLGHLLELFPSLSSGRGQSAGAWEVCPATGAVLTRLRLREGEAAWQAHPGHGPPVSPIAFRSPFVHI